jgi:serine/threonine protein phosphatase PrpC
VTLELRSAALSDVGRARERNEDAFFRGERVFAVADGLGGHNAGDVASRLAIEPLAALDRTLEAGRGGGVAEALARAVREANRAVFQRAQADARVRGMGTTLTAVAIVDSSAYLAHVGDSRCYLLRGGAISQLSSDHTLVARMVAEGRLTPEQAEVHPQRSILTRALGADPAVDVDTLEIPLVPGDRLLLCSDGLSSVVDEDRIQALLEEATDLEDGCRRLVDEANARGGPDNITVVVVEVAGAPPARVAPARRVRRARGPGPVRRPSARAVAWSLAVLALLLGGWLGFRAWVNRSFFVGIDGDRVAIFRGLPTEVAGLRLHRLEERTDVPVADVPAWYRPRLDEGIRAPSLAEARRIVRRVPRGAPPAPTAPTPAPT